MLPKPTTTVIRRLGPEELTAANQLLDVFDAAFAPWDRPEKRTYDMTKLLSNPAFIAFVVEVEGKVVAGLTAYELIVLSNGDREVLIYDFATHPEHQRSGIGVQLMKAFQIHCRENGITYAFLNAHSDNKGALEFYRSLDMDEVKVVFFGFETETKNSNQ
ncbi:MAG: GNAT family N-acetyltransferase [Bacteroidota bacterium]